MKKWSFVQPRLVPPVAQEPEGDPVVDKLLWLLALLRAQYWSYQHSHWVVRGQSAYGNHLLFQRLYESLTEQIDALAEKIVGTYGPDFLDDQDLLEMFEFWNNRWSEVSCLHQRGLVSEEDLQTVLEDTYHSLKDAEEITLGMDDFLMGLASDHETNMFLLRQVLQNKDGA
jgi:starvation-inducible DNA-binding protein